VQKASYILLSIINLLILILFFIFLIEGTNYISINGSISDAGFALLIVPAIFTPLLLITGVLRLLIIRKSGYDFKTLRFFIYIVIPLINNILLLSSSLALFYFIVILCLLSVLMIVYDLFFVRLNTGNA
jgi:hypothetical protein